jgi:hypothetical protein
MRALTLLAACVIASPALVHAQRAPLAPLVTQLPLGARAAAMGGGNAGNSDAEAVLVNPALAGLATTSALSFAHYREGTAGAVVGSSSTIGRFGLGVAVTYLDYEGLPVVGDRLSDDLLILPGTEPSASLHAAFGLSTTVKGFMFGASANYLEERVGLDGADALAITLGAARRLGPAGAMVGLTLQNLGRSLAFGASTVDLPMRVALGASGAQLPLGAWFDLVLDAGLAWRRDGLFSANGGAELTYVPIEGLSVALRGGVRRPELGAQDPFTGGIGVTLDRISLDYAWESLSDGSAHRIGIRLR